MFKKKRVMDEPRCPPTLLHSPHPSTHQTTLWFVTSISLMTN